MNRGIVTLAAVSSVLTGCTFGNEVRQTVHQAIQAGPAPTVSVSNVVGEVRVRSWNQPTIDITATKSASSEEGLKDIQIVVHKNGDAFSIETNYTGTFHSGGVRYDITVPAGASLDVENTTGAVHVAGVTGDVTVKTQTGEIDARLGKVDGKRHIDLSTTTGRVALAIDPSSSATVSARTTVGKVSSDFNAVESTERHVVGASAEGTIGNGSADIRLETTTGAIDLTKE